MTYNIGGTYFEIINHKLGLYDVTNIIAKILITIIK